MCKAIELSQYIIGLLPVDNLKLQKLLYYCQGVHLARTDGIIFEDKIEAWQYGPVVPNVYHKYKGFGFDIIKEDIQNEVNLVEEEIETIDMVLDYYGQFSGLELVSKTHSEDPWKEAYKPNENNEITIDSIKKYFKEMIEFD